MNSSALIFPPSTSPQRSFGTGLKPNTTYPGPERSILRTRRPRNASLVRCSSNHFNEVTLFLKNFSEISVSVKDFVSNSVPVLSQKGLIYFKELSASSFAQDVSELIVSLKVLASHLVSEAVKFLDDQQSFSALAAQVNNAIEVYSGNVSATPAPFLSSAIATAAGSAALGVIKNGEKEERVLAGEVLPLRYDPDAIATYFEKRPRAVASRILELAGDCSYLAAALAMDRATGMLKENERKRAKQFVNLLAKLGPTFIKMGQALSIRPDILPVAYLEELETLQDKVPPFSNETARMLIAEGLGRPLEEILSEISSEPIAAASLGQVYKGTLRETGEVVAVKVQRPGVLEGISRDLFLLRLGAKSLQSLPSIQSNLVALVDNLASRFFDELDYVQEAKNAERFSENMKSLRNIKVPRVFLQYTSCKVLITEWVEGEKLSECREEDLLYLVNAALTCYLVQLLESGFLHADPHPGNLLRTTDGHLCVLDFGLMTEVTDDQRHTFIEYMSHLVNGDYEKVADDLVRLGFVPPDLVDPVKTVEVVPLLSRVLGQLVQGGGARKLNVKQVTEDLAKISEDYVFVVPPYFALILKVFSVLEGLGLEADPNYVILHGCYPYLAKRLVTDDSPRTRATLKYFLYEENNRLDVKKVEDIFNGFEEFRKLTIAPSIPGSRRPLPSVDPAAKDVLSLLFSPNGSFLQELLLNELVCAVDALSRAALAEVWGLVSSQTFIPFPSNLSAPRSWPLFLPSLFFGTTKVASLSEDDEYYLDVIKRLWVFVEPRFRQQIFSPGGSELLQGLLPLVPDLFPGMTVTAQRFMSMLLQRQALRLADDLDGKKSRISWERDPVAVVYQQSLTRLPVLYKEK